MLAILVTLGFGRYDAGLGGAGQSAYEWPPHPARVFMALMASAQSDADLDALRWLERSEPPEVHACSFGDVRETEDRRFVVTNTVKPKDGGNLSHPGRTNAARIRQGVFLSEPSFALLWPAATPPEAVRRSLEQLARSVPYVGRVTTEATVRVLDSLPPRDRWTTYVPAALDVEGTLLRTPYPGFTDALRDAYLDGRRAHLTTRETVYTEVAVDQTSSEAASSPFGELLVFTIDTGTAPVDGRHLLRATTMLRRAVHERLGRRLGAPPKEAADVLPAVVSGHGADGTTHVAYLALPHVGARHADGRLLALALALPDQMTDADRRVLLQAVVTDEMSSVRLLRDLHLPVHVNIAGGNRRRDARRGVQPQRWTASDRGGSEWWTTATPLALDHFTRTRAHDEELVRQAFQRSGYEEPEVVELLAAPAIPGALNRPSLRLLTRERRRPLRHVRVRFPRRVVGPVIVGSLRYLGMGLFVPSDAPGNDPSGDRSGAVADDRRAENPA